MKGYELVDIVDQSRYRFDPNGDYDHQYTYSETTIRCLKDLYTDGRDIAELVHLSKEHLSRYESLQRDAIKATGMPIQAFIDVAWTDYTVALRVVGYELRVSTRSDIVGTDASLIAHDTLLLGLCTEVARAFRRLWKEERFFERAVPGRFDQFHYLMSAWRAALCLATAYVTSEQCVFSESVDGYWDPAEIDIIDLFPKGSIYIETERNGLCPSVTARKLFLRLYADRYSGTNALIVPAALDAIGIVPKPYHPVSAALEQGLVALRDKIAGRAIPFWWGQFLDDRIRDSNHTRPAAADPVSAEILARLLESPIGKPRARADRFAAARPVWLNPFDPEHLLRRLGKEILAGTFVINQPDAEFEIRDGAFYVTHPHGWDAILKRLGLQILPESVLKPLLYYDYVDLWSCIPMTYGRVDDELRFVRDSPCRLSANRFTDKAIRIIFEDINPG